MSPFALRPAQIGRMTVRKGDMLYMEEVEWRMRS